MKVKELRALLFSIVDQEQDVKIACGPDMWTTHIELREEENGLYLIDNPTQQEIEAQS